MSARDPLPPLVDSPAGLLRFITAGSVDDGKSTLIGRLLYDTKSLFADQLDAIAAASARRGKAAVDLSLLTDGLEDERTQGITIDVAYRYFATPRRKFIIGDTPGHEQYTRNMVTAASTADAAVILVDARLGVRPQTRRHATVAALLAVESLVFAVNKLDLLDYAEAPFRVLETELRMLADDIARHYGPRRVEVIPVSALSGANVVTRAPSGERDPMQWHRGPTLLELIEQLPPATHSGPEAPLRFPVQGVARPTGDGIAPELHDFRACVGRIESGRVALGDRVTILPSGRESTISRISIGGSDRVAARAPASVMLELADDLDVGRGDWIVAGPLPALARELTAQVCWLGESPLVPRARYWLKHGTRTVRAMVSAIEQRLDVHTLEPDGATGELGPNDIGRVRLQLAQPLPIERHAQSRIGGGFILIDETTHDTVAAGLVAG